MNLIINILFLLGVLIYGKKYANNFSNNVIYNNLLLIFIILSANFIYRIVVNIYLKKQHNIKDVINEAVTRSLIIIVSIIALNYLFTNPLLLSKLNINLDLQILKSEFPNAVATLIPYFLLHVTSCILVYDI